jgi:hypothetical protein
MWTLAQPPRSVLAYAALGFLLASVGESGAPLPGPIARWSFEEASGVAVDSVSGVEDSLVGSYQRVPGVIGNGLRFDGYTTAIVRSAKPVTISDAKGSPAVETIPRLGSAFTLSAWVALDAYPWNWLPLIDHDRDEQAGFSFGIDALGHVGLRLAVDGGWQSATSTLSLPLKQWTHLAATFDHTSGLALYIDGEEVARMAIRGDLTPAQGTDLLIGRVRHPTLPFPSASIHPLDPVWYSLEGILDEVQIWSCCLTAEQVRSLHTSVHAPAGEVLSWAKLPSGPPGAGRFGAYACTLPFERSWDRMRRMGPDSDVVVRFDRSAMRLVFWQGTAYEPAWVTGNGKWYTDEFLEAYGPPGCTGGEDCEPMSDKQTRYAHVSIVQSNDARAVIHWRYALSETRNYSGAFTDPVTGWFDWADEYWTVYPDGVAIRRQVLWSTEQADWAHEWQETIVINGPGQRPEDNINYEALSLANMKGESASYHWGPKTDGLFDYPHGPTSLPGPPNANIQVINLKSAQKPFQIVPPDGAKIVPYSGERSYSAFEWWNHWPVAQIPSSGRPALVADRASHSSLSHIYWGMYQRTDRSLSKLLMDGLTEKTASDLVPLAKSWLSPPKMDVTGPAHGEGYDPAQRAFLIQCNPGETGPLEVTWHGGPDSPLVNPALVLRGWTIDACLRVDGKDAAPGDGLRIGHERRLDEDDLVIWMDAQAARIFRIEITPPRPPSK